MTNALAYMSRAWKAMKKSLITFAQDQNVLTGVEKNASLWQQTMNGTVVAKIALQQLHCTNCIATIALQNCIATIALQQLHCNNCIATIALQKLHYNNCNLHLILLDI